MFDTIRITTTMTTRKIIHAKTFCRGGKNEMLRVSKLPIENISVYIKVAPYHPRPTISPRKSSSSGAGKIRSIAKNEIEMAKMKKKVEHKECFELFK